MWVVKLGGSLAGADALPRWLDALATEGRGRAVIVPGGGPFAGQVRTMQARWRFGDAAAHHMALLAMEQYALMLRGLRPDLAPVMTPSDAHRALELDRTAIWMPSAIALAGCELPRSWDTTSDSLAAWFAAQLGASHLVLVKSVQLNAPAVSAHWLRENGMVDRLFPELVAQSAFTTLFLGPSDEQRLRSVLHGEDEGVVVHAVQEASEGTSD